jgi:23S rRNA (cytidine1920-2'-O)/16S rRNA (cytidine1409-2'-O)-methyltransferase
MRKRLDQTLVERGLTATRSRARDLILRGRVRVDDSVIVRPAALVADTSELTLADGHGYVSRGALKLEAGLAAFGFEVKDRTALDIGASTGGFTEVLLGRGAAKIYAVDVGRGQLHESLRGNPRVVSLERCDARTLTRDRIPDPIGAIVADVSFISLEKALPPALALAAPGAWLIALIKPQFEVGPGGVNKDGVVRDACRRDKAVAGVSAWLAARTRWHVAGVVPSPIDGGSGNEEFLLGATFRA